MQQLTRKPIQTIRKLTEYEKSIFPEGTIGIGDCWALDDAKEGEPIRVLVELWSAYIEPPAPTRPTNVSNLNHLTKNKRNNQCSN